MARERRPVGVLVRPFCWKICKTMAEEDRATRQPQKIPLGRLAPQEHGAFQTAQGLAGQFHTDGEQQHGHAQLRHITDGLAVHDAQQGRPAQYAGQQKSYGCRQLYLVAYKVDDDGKQENDDQFIEQFKMHLYLRGRCEPARHAPVPDRLGMPFAGELS